MTRLSLFSPKSSHYQKHLFPYKQCGTVYRYNYQFFRHAFRSNLYKDYNAYYDIYVTFNCCYCYAFDIL